MPRMGGSPGSPLWKELRGTYAYSYRYSKITNGTSGTITVPQRTEIVPDPWADGVDALASEVGAGGIPNWKTPQTTRGGPVTATLDVKGNWTLSDIPDTYPVALVYYSRCSVVGYNPANVVSETGFVVESEPAPVGAMIEIHPEAPIPDTRYWTICDGGAWPPNSFTETEVKPNVPDKKIYIRYRGEI